MGSALTSIPPPLEDSNTWADYWRDVIGVNVIPAKTKEKKVFVKWSEWQLRPIPQELHDKWKDENAFADGMAIIAGKVWHGDHKGNYLIFIDCDNALAIDELCTSPSGEKTTLENLSKNFIVEQHPDNKSKAHIYFYSKIPFVKKGTDISGAFKTKRCSGSEIPAIEIKGEGIHGLAYCTPSFHKNGHRYQIIGNLLPTIRAFDKRNARVLMKLINRICKKYGLRYLELDDGNGNAMAPITDLFKEDFVIHEKHNRHGALLRVIESLIKRNVGIMSLEEIEVYAHTWNENHCKPPLDDREFKKQWNAATNWIKRKQLEEQEKEGRRQQEQQDQEQKPEEKIELTEDLIKETTFDDTASVLDTSIKQDKAPKVISFCGMLLAQTNNDQLNIGFQAESSAGKSYIPLEVAAYFPKHEIEIIATASPTAFFHDGIWDNEKKVLVRDLRHKILIFQISRISNC